MRVATVPVRTPRQQRSGRADLIIRIDGRRPPSAEAVADVAAVCDAAEDHDAYGRVIIHVTGTPGQAWRSEFTVTMIGKWERILRRLERLPATTVAVASGDCGGLALDALLATDYRIADPAVRLLIPARTGATWLSLALYRLTTQAGVAAVRRAVLLGRPIDAEEAVMHHLIDEVTEDAAGALSAMPQASGPELAIRRRLMLDTNGRRSGRSELDAARQLMSDLHGARPAMRLLGIGACGTLG